MTQQQRETLVYCTGVLEGMSWLAEKDVLADALGCVKDEIEKMLKEDEDGGNS